MSKQQTAVDWYYQQTVIEGKTNYWELFEQAKQMEKEQNIGLLRWMNKISKSEPMRLETDFDDIVEQYYNETYKQ